MQAALTARKRGLDVTLYEKEAEIGGELNHIGNPDFKEDFRNYAAYIKNAVKKCGAKIITGHEATAEELAAIGYDAVIVAEGSHVSCPPIPGIETSGVLDPIPVIDGVLPEGEEVLVCGAGLVGCEAALVLAEKGKKVTMIDQLPEHAPNMPIYAKWVLNARLAETHVKICTNHMIKELRPGEVVTCDKDGNEEVFKGDAVVLALGLTPNHKLANELRRIAPQIRVLTAGDTNGSRKIMNSTEEGYHAARII
jgi:2-enoate reductase